MRRGKLGWAGLLGGDGVGLLCRLLLDFFMGYTAR
jgi:hypothetical protein